MYVRMFEKSILQIDTYVAFYRSNFVDEVLQLPVA